jgi:hypothetical protein
MATTTGVPVTNLVASFSTRPTVVNYAPSAITFNNFSSTAGSGYVNGTYTNVPLTFLSGKVPTHFPKATITVAGGKVSTVSVDQFKGGAGADTSTIFTVDSTLIGGSGTGFQIGVTQVNDCKYAVPFVTVSSVAGSASNEYHYFDAGQFEKAAAPTEFDEARQIHVTLKATRINELANPHFYNGVLTPWTVSGATIGSDLEAADPTFEPYSTYSVTVQDGVATVNLTTVHDFKTGDYIVIDRVGSPFNGAHLLTSVDDTQLFFSLAVPNSATAFAPTGRVFKLGDSLVITSTSSNLVTISSKTTSSDLMGIYYPLTPYTFSIYMYTDQSTDTVCPAIVWYDKNKNVISTTDGEDFTLNQEWSRPYVSAVAPATAAYAECIVKWNPGAAGNTVDCEAAMFENSAFPQEFFDGSIGPANRAELVWENNQPNNARSHYYKNFFALRTRLNGGLLQDYISLGNSIAVYFAQPNT